MEAMKVDAEIMKKLLQEHQTKLKAPQGGLFDVADGSMLCGGEIWKNSNNLAPPPVHGFFAFKRTCSIMNISRQHLVLLHA